MPWSVQSLIGCLASTYRPGVVTVYQGWTVGGSRERPYVGTLSSLPVNETDLSHRLDEALGTRLRIEAIELSPRMGAAKPHRCAMVPLPAPDN